MSHGSKRPEEMCTNPAVSLRPSARSSTDPERLAPCRYPDPLPPDIQQGVLTTMAARDPSEADIPLGALRRTSFPKLVNSGGHSSVSEAICDVLQRELNSERATIPGVGHSVPRAGNAFNEHLEAFLKGA